MTYPLLQLTRRKYDYRDAQCPKKIPLVYNLVRPVLLLFFPLNNYNLIRNKGTRYLSYFRIYCMSHNKLDFKSPLRRVDK